MESSAVVRPRGRILPSTWAGAAVGALASILVALDVRHPWPDRDEAATLYSAGLSWHALLVHAHAQDAVLVPYYLLVHGWNHLASGLAADRLLSVVGYGLAVAAAGAIVGRLTRSTAWAVVGASATAVNPLLAQEAINARPYALSAGTATLAVWAMLVAVEDDRDGFVYAAAAATAATAALHFLSAMGPLAAIAVLVVGNRAWAARHRTALTTGGLLAGGVFVTFAAFGHAQRAQLSWLNPLTIRNAVTQVSAPFGGGPAGALPQALLSALVVCLALPELLARRAVVIALIAWGLVPGVVLVVASWLATPVYGDRYVTESAPAVAILVTMAAAWASGRRRRAALAGLVLLLAFDVPFAVKYARQWQTLDQFQAAAATVDRRARPGDVLALPNHDVETIVPRYLHRSDLVHWPTVPRQDVETFMLDVRPPAFAAAGSRVWIVDISSPYDKRARAAFEGDLRERGYALERRTLFGGTIVELFARSRVRN